MIELDATSARDLNDLLEYSCGLPSEQKFNVGFYTKYVLDGQTRESYTYYMALIKLAERLISKYNASWIGIDIYGDIRTTWQTRSFLDQGGFLTILNRENETRQVASTTILSNKTSIVNAVVTFIIAVTVLTLQIIGCYRDDKKERIELIRRQTDSIEQQNKARHDSLHETQVLRLLQDISINLKKDSTK